ncbi:MAG: hypothetical protein WC136_04925 [Sphaerochaeta sp.]
MLQNINNPILDIICQVNNRENKLVEVTDKIYEIGHFNAEDILDNNQYEYSDIDYGVCDNVEQLENKYNISGNPYIAFMTPIVKSNAPSEGGWRWCKWGQYIGTHEITSEYLYDEPQIEKVYVFSIYKVHAKYNEAKVRSMIHSPDLDMNDVTLNVKLSESFIREHSDKLEKYWLNISSRQKLSEDLIKEFEDKVDWDMVSLNQKLSDQMIRKYSDRLNWLYIGCHQQLSDDIILEFIDRLNYNDLLRFQNLSQEMIERINTIKK